MLNKTQRLKTVRSATPVMQHITALYSPLSTIRKLLNVRIIDKTEDMNSTLLDGPDVFTAFLQHENCKTYR
jgi:hypothetical protein